jgi:formylglycine-generating enzyme required for sulfatase activity
MMRPSAPQPTARRAGEVFKDCTDCPELVVIPAGSFTMGSNDYYNEEPPHSVSIKSLALGKTEVTQGQWKAVMGSNPSYFKQCGDHCPVESVSWNDAQEYIKKLNAKTGKLYRLPSESEWEYAARGATNTKWSHGDNESALGDYGWYIVNSGTKTHAVGQKRSNPYGLHDMHGNVWEWVEDCRHENYSRAPSDGSAWTSNCKDTYRVRRGGSWSNSPVFLRSASRDWSAPDIRNTYGGFRIARTF